MKRALVCLLTLCLLAVAAFSPAASAASPSSPAPALGIPPAASPTAVPTVTLPPLDPSRLAGSPPTSGDASQIKTWLREESGLREQLGPAAEELFQLADQAETAAV